MKRILIATDGSDGADLALHDGFSLAERLDAEAIVLYVRRPPSSLLGAPYYQDVVTEEARRARAVIADAKLRAAHYRVDPEYEVAEGDPVDEIVTVGRSSDVDLIVVGSRGLGSVAGLMLGSVSSAVLHEADRPVLVAKCRLREPAVLGR
jgi:nucleotide-binding universal stress UspA family protein